MLAVPHLVVVAQRVSEAQAEYQKARVTPGSISNLFYKDATPRAEHFINMTVRLLGREHWPWHAPIPLRLVLCYDDGTPLDSTDQASLRVLSLSQHVRAAIPADADMASFSYRIELGSFRRADRCFAVKIEVYTDASMDVHSPPSALSNLVEPALTPAVYVLSKKKLDVGASPRSSTPRAEAKRKHDIEDEDDEVSEDSMRKLQRSFDSSRGIDDAAEVILQRLDSLEQSINDLAGVVRAVIAHLSHAPSAAASPM